MNVIKFPGDYKKPITQTSIEPISKLVIGDLSFTCTTCNEVCSTEFTKMIFRSIEFHCAKCGTFFKITNPAFVISKPKK
jgi:transcription elongation factor Elf1